MNEKPCYGPKVDEALALAADAFRTTRRKKTEIPYLTHLMQVAVWVWERGGDEEQAIAALLHDYLEDVDGATEEELRGRFGERVARLVAELSDATVRPKPPWKERKTRYLEHLRRAPAEVKLISACDKLHNAASILRDLETEGESVFDRFRAPKGEVLWYYREVARALAEDWDHPLLPELRQTIARIHHRAGVHLPPDGA